MSMPARPDPQANRRTALTVAGVAVGMLALAYASVPLYRLFCQVTGFGGTTQVATTAPAAVGDKIVKVRFDANVGGRDLPWRFEPVEREIEVRVGEERLVHYRVTNVATYPVTGTATFNVTPTKAGAYFQKIACFCFTEQRLAAGESMLLPVSFFVDPEIVNDASARGVDAITLSYTFFRVRKDEDGARTSQATSASPAGGIN